MPTPTVFRERERKRRVFESVFPSLNNFSQPTPAVEHVAPGQTFGGPAPYYPDYGQTPLSAAQTHVHYPELSSPSPEFQPGGSRLRDQEVWNRSWHKVTSVLSLPDDIFSGQHQFHIPTRNTRSASISSFSSALRNVLSPDTRLPDARHTENLLAWFAQHSRHHFLSVVMRALPKPDTFPDRLELVAATVQVLEDVHREYLDRLGVILQELAAMGLQTSDTPLRRFKQDLHAIISYSLTPTFGPALKDLLSAKVNQVLGIPRGDPNELRVEQLDETTVEHARRSLLGFLGSLHNVGMGGESLYITFAEVMDLALTWYVRATFAKVWMQTDDGFEDSSVLPRTANHLATSRCIMELCSWVEDSFSRLAYEVLTKIQASKPSWQDVEKWKEMSIGRLVALRIDELFDLVLNWPESMGALSDLRAALNTPQRRLELTDVFSEAVDKRLLHSGTSTLTILQAYISIIWSFHSLDNSRVLLDRVAYPLQMYLRSRDDTVKLIISGLLADVDGVENEELAVKTNKSQLVELALLLRRPTEDQNPVLDDDLDWDDPEWYPEPVDAGPRYRRSRSADVIGTLIDMLGAKEVFIKEFQTIIGENLLKHEGNFEREIKLLELLKRKFGEGPLQSCEVMIKDIQDSKRVNQAIRRVKELGPSEQEIQANKAAIDMEENVISEGLLRPSLHAKILSRLFWPQLQDDEYEVPHVISELQKQYESGFESLKSSRKLTWLPALGQATVELEFADRVLFEEVHTWQATVVWAFQSADESAGPVSHTVSHLVESLGMEEALVRSALSFWVNKFVLYESGPDEYAVLETLNQDERARSSAQATSAATGSGTATAGDAGGSVADEDDEDQALVSAAPDNAKMGMYWQYIQGMLTNAAPQMPLQQIAMMLKMLIADGFPYSNEELGEFLAQKVEDGELVFAGGKYKLKK